MGEQQEGVMADPGGGAPGGAPEAKKGIPTILIVLGACGCLLFVMVPIIGIVAAIAIPNLLRSKMAANETWAIASMRTYCGAQNIYHRTDYDGDEILEYCTPANEEAPSFTHLYSTTVDGQPIELIDSGFAAATSSVSPKGGYYFVDIMKDANGNDYNPAFQYGLCAVPAQYNRSGLMTFIIDVQGTVFMQDNGGQAVTEFPDVDDPGSMWMVCE